MLSRRRHSRKGLEGIQGTHMGTTHTNLVFTLHRMLVIFGRKDRMDVRMEVLMEEGMVTVVGMEEVTVEEDLVVDSVLRWRLEAVYWADFYWAIFSSKRLFSFYDIGLHRTSNGETSKMIKHESTRDIQEFQTKFTSTLPNITCKANPSAFIGIDITTSTSLYPLFQHSLIFPWTNAPRGTTE